MFRYVYEHTDDDSPLRGLFVHFCTWNMDFNEFKVLSSQIPPEMLIDLVTAMRLLIMSEINHLESSDDFSPFHVIE